jgi:biopolymer transport protein ExbD
VNFGRKNSRQSEALIDLTAMLDVTFNLLLFFVVTTSFDEQRDKAKEEMPGIQVDLPRSSAQAIINDDRDINVWMTKDGAVYLDEQPVDLPTLRQVFRERAAKDPTTLVVIKADEGVSHGRVVAIMDQAKSYGLSRLAIATEAEGDLEEEDGRDTKDG